MEETLFNNSVQEPAKQRAPRTKKPAAKKPGVKKASTKKEKKIELVDFTKVKGTRVEYFDDRFYKLSLPKAIDPSWIENIPEEYRDDAEENFLNVYLPSVTTIISNAEPKPILERWRGDVGNWEADRRSQEGKDKGSRIHKSCELLSNGVAIIFQNPKTENVTAKEIRDFAKKYKCKTHILHSQEDMIQVARFDRLNRYLQPEIIETEQQVFSLKECYAGTLDGLWNVKGGDYKLGRNKFALLDGLYIIDFKTGKWFDETNYYTQLSAYLEAHPEQHKVNGCIIIHLNADIKSGIHGLKVHVKEREELQPYYQHFLDLKRVYNFSNKQFPKLFEVPQVLLWKKEKKTK